MMLHAVCCGEEAGARNRAFFRVKWLQPAMKATSSVRRLRLGSFGSFYVFCNNACSCVRSSMRFLTLWSRSHWNGCMMLHGLCCGEEAGARNRVFFRVKWLQPAMKATSSVRRLRLGSFGSFYVFCNNACSCVRSSMRFLTLWCQIALEWLHDVAWALCWGGSRSTKPCVFPCKVAAAGDESYLVCAAVAAGVVWFLLCVLQQCLFCVRSSMRFLTLWCQIALEWLHDVACRVLWGGSRSTKPCVFPCKVAAAGDESYLVCATVAAGVVWFLLCVLQQCLFLCA